MTYCFFPPYRIPFSSCATLSSLLLLAPLVVAFFFSPRPPFAGVVLLFPPSPFDPTVAHRSQGARLDVSGTVLVAESVGIKLVISIDGFEEVAAGREHAVADVVAGCRFRVDHVHDLTHVRVQIPEPTCPSSDIAPSQS